MPGFMSLMIDPEKWFLVFLAFACWKFHPVIHRIMGSSWLFWVFLSDIAAPQRWQNSINQDGFRQVKHTNNPIVDRLVLG